MAEARSNSGLIWAGLGIAGAYVLYKNVIQPGIVVPHKLQQYTQKIRIQVPAVRFKGDNVEFDVYVQNPNPTPLTINAIVGDVYVTYGQKSIKMGNVSRYGDVVIKPLAETKYTFSVRLKVLSLVAYFNDILAGKAAGQTFTFKGTITINKRPWPITEHVKL